MDNILDAKHAMLLARIELDHYISSSESDPIRFEELYQSLRDSTAEYARLIKERMIKCGSVPDEIATVDTETASA